jgi:hypothetical protein
VAQNNQRERALEVIRENIACSGHHTYVVSAGGQTPRFAYTIGVSESIGVELILAGAIFYMKDDLVTIINEIPAKMKAQPDCESSRSTDKVRLLCAKYIAVGHKSFYWVRSITIKNAIFECFRLFPTRLTGPSMYLT